MRSKGLYELWQQHRKQLLKCEKDNKIAVNDLYFSWLTNNGFLYEIEPVITSLLENNESHKKFLLKIEELKMLSEEITFMFKGDEKETLSSFVKKYCELLFVMFQYQIAFNHLLKQSEKFPRNVPEKDGFLEQEKRHELIDKVNNLDRDFLKISEK